MLEVPRLRLRLMGESKGEEEAFMSWQYAPGPGVPSRASLVVLEHGLVYEAMRAVLSSAHGEGLRPGLCGSRALTGVVC